MAWARIPATSIAPIAMIVANAQAWPRKTSLMPRNWYWWMLFGQVVPPMLPGSGLPGERQFLKCGHSGLTHVRGYGHLSDRLDDAPPAEHGDSHGGTEDGGNRYGGGALNATRRAPDAATSTARSATI